MLESSTKINISATPKGTATSTVSSKLSQQPVLNGKYALMNRLGEGNTSKVYLA